MKMSQKMNNAKGTKEEKERKQPERIEAVLGLKYPVTRMQNFLRNEVGGFDRISKKASAGLSAVIEYINDRIFESAIDISAQRAKSENFRVNSSHVAKAIQNDEVLQDLVGSSHFKGTNDGWKIDWFDHWKDQKKETDRLRARRVRKEKRLMEEEEEQMPKTNQKNKGKKKGGNKKKKNEEEDS